MQNDVRLIDANALTRWLESVLSNANPLDRRARAAFSEVLARVKTMLDIDAVPVVHARWELFGADKRGRGGVFNCTACNRCRPTKSDYCPNCGAKMDGDMYDG